MMKDGPNILSNVALSRASGGSYREKYNFYGGLSVIRSRVNFENVTIRKFSSEDSVSIYESYIDIRGMNLKGGYSDGIDADWSYGVIANSIFKGCGGDCIDLSGSNIRMTDNVISNAYDKCISIGESSYSYISRNRISNCHVGIAIKDQSIVRGESNLFTGNQSSAIAQYIKKPNYTAPRVYLSGSDFEDNGQEVVIADMGQITSDFNRIWPTEKFVFDH